MSPIPDRPAWVVWYSDGTSFTSLDGAPHEAPRWGVLCIAAESQDHGRVIWHGTDYYVWNDGWVSCDATGLLDYFGNIPGAEKIVLIGRHVPPRIFHQVYAAADADPRLPPRSSTDQLEQRRPNL